jgi:hypothetical protein
MGLRYDSGDPSPMAVTVEAFRYREGLVKPGKRPKMR